MLLPRPSTYLTCGLEHHSSSYTCPTGRVEGRKDLPAEWVPHAPILPHPSHWTEQEEIPSFPQEGRGTFVYSHAGKEERRKSVLVITTSLLNSVPYTNPSYSH